ncbi:MAG: MBL fold metallo-hydrolase, partial [Nitriliruptoraceae bacterium]
MTNSHATWTVLGSAGSHTGPGRVCAGHLLRTEEATVLVDAGNGATANLQRFVTLEDLDAIFVSHRHIDHCIDLIGMFYARRFDPRVQRRLALYAPEGVIDALTSMLSADSALEFAGVFDVHDIAAGAQVTIGDVDVTCFTAVHPVPTVSMRFVTAAGVAAYSADTAANPALV